MVPKCNHIIYTQYSAIRNIFSSDSGTLERQIDYFKGENSLDEPGNIAIVIRRIPPPLTEQQMSELSSSIDVRAHSESNGIDIYVRFILEARHS